MTRGERVPRAVRGAAALLLALVAAGTSGCSSLAFWRTPEERAAAAREKAEAAEPPVPTAPLYALAVDAPGKLDDLLLQHLDLGRFRIAPEGETVSDAELERLINATPAQARALLETEGYFNAQVTVTREPAAAGLRRVRVQVVPGPRVVVRSVEIGASGPLAPPADPRADPDRLDTLRKAWPLKPGFPFRNDDWAAAKVATLRPLRLDGHAAATLGATHARIDAVDNTAALSVEVAPGPRFRFGRPVVTGLERYDADAVTRLMTFAPGDTYREQALLDWQDRLLKSGLFEGASVSIEPDPAQADAVPVQVAVKELTQRQAIYGIGYSANTGPRASVEYIDRKPFDQRLIWHSKIEWGADRKLIASDLTTWPLEDGWRHALGASAEKLRSTDETRDAWALRLARSRETARYDRAWSLEAQHAQVDGAAYDASATALFGQFAWVRRDLDSVLLPSEGSTLSVQLGTGLGNGSRTTDEGTERARGPFLRAWARAYWYRPVGDWSMTVRAEAGQVLTRSAVAIPDTLLFRAGGDDSVRGYGYRSLGPEIAGTSGAVGSGRVLGTGSVEFAHPLLRRLPDLLGAVFVDAGNAADRWQDLKPVVGYGVGLRYRSPVGPLRLDVAYGQAVRSVRLHFSVGVVF